MNYQPQFNPAYQPACPGGYAPAPMMDNLSLMRAPYMQSIQPSAAPAQQNNSGVIWVQGEEGAKAYMVAAGNSVMLLDSENTTFYIKSTDQSGMPMPLRIFDYTERTQASRQTLPMQAVQQEEYITRAEFEAALAKLMPQRKLRKAATEEVSTDE